jgi:hypothetical protein
MALKLKKIASKLDLIVAAVEGQERPLNRKLKAAFQEHIAGVKPEDLSADEHDMMIGVSAPQRMSVFGHNGTSNCPDSVWAIPAAPKSPDGVWTLAR